MRREVGMRFPGGAAAALCALIAFVLGCARDAPPRILLLVTVDTLRADELGAWGSEHGLTPELDALARSGVVFRRAYAPASFTLPSVAAILTGRYPEQLGIRSNESALPDRAGTLAAELAALGWRTSAVVGNFVLRRSAGTAQGFQHFDDEFPALEPGSRAMPERRAAETTAAAVALLDDCVTGPPCLIWLHYQDPHGPYAPPPEWRERAQRFESGLPDASRELPVGRDQWGRGSIPAYQSLGAHREVGFYRSGYRGEIAYTDAQVGRLLRALRERDLEDETVVVFAADHGESLGEGDLWFSHGTRLGDEQVRVPLILRVPGRQASVRDDVASLVDLHPTLLALLAGRPPDPGRPGRDLLAPDAGEAGSRAYLSNLGVGGTRRYGLVEGEFKFVAAERRGLFDGSLHQVDREELDLTAAAPHVGARLRARLIELRERFGSEVPETPQQLDEADRDRLRALGYLPASDPGD